MSDLYSSRSFEEKYTYPGNDLGAAWTAQKTTFRLWAPTAEEVTVNLYRSGTAYADDLLCQVPMQPDQNGTWVAEREGDLNGLYYTYLVMVDGTICEACDPYARTTGVNGDRAMILDLDSTDPQGWEADSDPHAGSPITDAVIYELHIRDLSMHRSSRIKH
ncbi:MAG: type I pullulanase, partial [Faecousia sp.]